MNVTLLAHTPLPEHVIASAAKLCYSSSSIADLTEKTTDANARNFVEMLSNIGHESPIEHAVFTFGIEGVSRAVLAQITRHRIASFSVQSQRYVRESHFEYIVPPEIEHDEKAREIYLKSMTDAQKAYDDLTEVLFEKHNNRLLADGISEKTAKSKAEKLAIEDARFVLPNACETKIVMTMNARSLLNFFSLRCCNRAQWEIRAVAEAMFKICYEIAPAIFAKAGPKCLFGACPEGKMTCGKMGEVREKYTKIRESF